MKEKIAIQDTKNQKILAEAIEDEGVLISEGIWYFEPDKVDMTHLVKTERTYRCHYKGVCYWIDLDAPDHKAQDVAFVYFTVLPGYEFIKDRIGFYSGEKEDTREVTTPVE